MASRVAVCTRDTEALIDALNRDPQLAQRVGFVRTRFPYNQARGDDIERSFELLRLCPNVRDANIEQADLPLRLYNLPLAAQDRWWESAILRHLTRLQLTHGSVHRAYTDRTIWQGTIVGLFDVFQCLPALKHLEGILVPGSYFPVSLPTPPFRLERLTWIKSSRQPDSGVVQSILIACSSDTLRELVLDPPCVATDGWAPFCEAFASVAPGLETLRLLQWSSHVHADMAARHLLPLCRNLRHLSLPHAEPNRYTQLSFVSTLEAVPCPLRTFEVMCYGPSSSFYVNDYLDRTFMVLLRTNRALRLLRRLSFCFGAPESEEDVERTLEMLLDLRAVRRRVEISAVTPPRAQ